LSCTYDGIKDTIQLTTEDGDTTVSFGNVVDKLLDEHGLADTSTTKQTNLATTSVRGE
jgi:hypothetical protein